MGKKEIKYYFQAEIAKELNVSEATVSRIIRQNAIKPAKEEGKKRLFSQQQLNRIAFLLSEKKERKDGDAGLDSLSRELKKEIENLKKDKEQYIKELAIKDNQINQLNDRLKMAQINLSQSQQLQLEQSQKIKELEAPETSKIVEAESAVNRNDNEVKQNKRVKHRWFSFWN